MDFYFLLGVEREASLAEIKRAYKRLARKYHPDINPGDRLAAQQFRQIAEAYETLADPDRRRQYDTGGVQLVNVETTAFGFEGFDFSVRVSGDAAPTFGDLFADVFRQQGERARPERGADLHVALRLSFEDSLRGGARQVTVARLVHCRGCHGTGAVRTTERRCASCHGSGIVKSTRNHMVFSKSCQACGGTGMQAHTRCPACQGRQLEMLSESLPVTIPAGLHDGARVRLPGMGHAGANGGDAGDLYIAVQVDPDSRFTRQGDDLHLTVPIAIHEAALGGKVELQSFDGIVRLRVPAGTQTGQRFRFSERGAPSPRDGRRGDLVIEVKMVLPPLLDERSKELLREFGRINGADVRQELA